MVSAVSIAWMSALALLTWAFSTFPKTLGRITAASRPMMTTTTMISMSVKPRAMTKLGEMKGTRFHGIPVGLRGREEWGAHDSK